MGPRDPERGDRSLACGRYYEPREDARTGNDDLQWQPERLHRRLPRKFGILVAVDANK